MLDTHIPSGARALNHPQLFDPRPLWRPGTPTSAKRIMREVCDSHGVSLQLLLSERRYRAINRVRQEAMLRCRAEITIKGLPPSWARMGRWFGRHHTSVMCACGVLASKRPRNHSR